MFQAENNMENLARCSRLEGKLRFEMINFETLKGEVMSEPTLIGNVPWRIVARPSDPIDECKALELSLRCDGDGENPNWKCDAFITTCYIREYSKIPTEADHTFNSQSHEDLAFFITWPSLMNPAFELVQSGRIVIEADVKLKEPAALNYDFGRSNATLRYWLNSDTLSQDVDKYSPSTYLRNLPWRIEVDAYPKDKIEKNKTLGIYLKCLGDPELPEWSCKVNAKIIIMTHLRGASAVGGETWSHTFSQAENKFGFESFITFNKLFNTTNGFIKDNLLQILIDFTADDARADGPENHVLNGAEAQANQAGIIPVSRLRLQCPICLELPRKEVYQCKNGHSLCDSCYSNVQFCPQCRGILGGEWSRNRAIEEILDDVEMDCRYTGNTCNFKALRQELPPHENSCRFRPFCLI